MIAIALCGCSKPKVEGNRAEDSANNQAAKSANQEPIAVATGAGKDTRYGQSKDQTSARIPLWEIAWDSANLAIVKGQQSGYMFKVRGRVYDDGEAAGEFSAARAEADKAANRLLLDGGIVIKSEKVEMKAKKVEWLPDMKVFKASGDVTLDGKDGAIGPVDDLYVSAKLERVATSLSYFQNKKK